MRKTIIASAAALSLALTVQAAPATAATSPTSHTCVNATRSVWLWTIKRSTAPSGYWGLTGWMSGAVNDTTAGVIYTPAKLTLAGKSVGVAGTKMVNVRKGVKARAVAEWTAYHYRPGAGKPVYTDRVQCVSVWMWG